MTLEKIKMQKNVFEQILTDSGRFSENQIKSIIDRGTNEKNETGVKKTHFLPMKLIIFNKRLNPIKI